MKLINDDRNLSNLRKLSVLLIRDGCDADEIFEYLEQAYLLGKTEGRLEITIENGALARE